jgi:hypothetical protein
MMVKSLKTAAENRWLVWGSFGLGFLLPPFFLLFLALAAVAAYRELRGEYEDVARYWENAAEETLHDLRERREGAFPNALAAAHPL